MYKFSFFKAEQRLLFNFSFFKFTFVVNRLQIIRKLKLYWLSAKPFFTSVFGCWYHRCTRWGGVSGKGGWRKMNKKPKKGTPLAILPESLDYSRQKSELPPPLDIYHVCIYGWNLFAFFYSFLHFWQFWATFVWLQDHLAICSDEHFLYCFNSKPFFNQNFYFYFYFYFYCLTQCKFAKSFIYAIALFYWKTYFGCQILLFSISVFPKLRSEDHFWSAWISNLVREKKLYLC